MNTELLQAIKERIDLGYTYEQISEELLAAGYASEVVADLYQRAHAAPPIPSNGDNQFAPDPQVTAAATATWPGARQLYTIGYNFLLQNASWVWLLSAPILCVTLLQYVRDQGLLDGRTELTLLSAVAAVLLVVWYVLNIGAVLYVVTRSSQQPVSYGEAMVWSRGHILGWLWVSVLVGCVVLGGFVLFIIPGIIFSLYLYFSQYVYAVEGKRGMAALLRSYQLMSGNMSAVFWVLLKVSILFFLVYALIGILVGLVAVITNDSPVATLLINIGSEVVGAAMTIIMLKIGMTLYETLVVKSAGVAKTVTTLPLYIFGWVGFVIVALFILIILMAARSGTFEQKADPIITQDSFLASAALQVQLRDARTQADTYAASNASYTGVCAELAQYVPDITDMTCNENQVAYALAGTIGEETWCIDSRRYAKPIQTELGERTECLATPVLPAEEPVPTVPASSTAPVAM